MQKNKSALSLAEILVATIILVIAAAGLFASFIAANKFVERSKRRMAAVNLARIVSEQLYKQVQADTWIDPNNNLLACAAYPCDKDVSGLLPSPLPTDNPLSLFNPTAIATISLDGTDPVNSPRKVTIRIEWTE